MNDSESCSQRIQDFNKASDCVHYSRVFIDAVLNKELITYDQRYLFLSHLIYGCCVDLHEYCQDAEKSRDSEIPLIINLLNEFIKNRNNEK